MLRKNNSLAEAEAYRKKFTQAPEDTRTKDVMENISKKTPEVIKDMGFSESHVPVEEVKPAQDSGLVDIDVLKQKLIEAKVKGAHLFKSPEKIVEKAKEYNLIP